MAYFLQILKPKTSSSRRHYSPWKVRGVIFHLLIGICIVYNKVLAQNEEEGSGEVCNIEASTCPDDKCCTDLSCEKENKKSEVNGAIYKCCELKDGETYDEFAYRRGQPEGAECATCPKCGKK